MRPFSDAEAVELIRQGVPDVVAVYRFGSSVEGTTHPRSDVDLAFLALHPMGPVARFELQERMASAFGQDIDLVDLRAASTVMQMQVVSKGVLLAEPDHAEKERFETYVFSAYARLNEERRAIVEQVLREGTVLGR